MQRPRADPDRESLINGPLSLLAYQGSVATSAGVTRLTPVTASGTRIEMNGVTVTTNQPADMILYVTDHAILWSATAANIMAPNVRVTGLATSTTWHWDLNAKQVQGVVDTPTGELTLQAPHGRRVVLAIMDHPGTLTVRTTADCAALLGGVMVGRVCRLAADVGDAVIIAVPEGMTLDCAGHTIRGPVGTAFGLQLLDTVPTGALVGARNCRIEGFSVSIFSVADWSELVSNVVAGAHGGTAIASAGATLTIRGNEIGGAHAVGISVLGMQAGAEIADNNISVQSVGIFESLGSTPNTAQRRIVNNLVDTGSTLGSFGIQLDRQPGLLGTKVEGNTIRTAGGGVAVISRVPTAELTGGAPLIRHNNVFAGGLGVFSQTMPDGAPFPIPVPLEASVGGQGNHWGHTALPLFVPGVDSNYSLVTDSYAYCAQDGWNTGYLPGSCTPTAAPRPPVVEFPAAGGLYAAPVSELRGTSEGATVEAWVGGAVMASAPVSGGRFVLPLQPPMGEGAHAVDLYALVPAPGQDPLVSLPTAVSFSVRVLTLTAPAISTPRAGQSLAARSILASGSGMVVNAVELVVDGGAPRVVDVDATGKWSTTLDSVAPGSHVLTATTVMGQSRGPSTSAAFSVTGPVSTVALPGGRATLNVTNVQGSQVSPAVGETISADYRLTARMPAGVQRNRVAVALVKEALLDANNRGYLRQGKAVKLTGAPGTSLTTAVTFTFDGRNQAGAAPAVDTPLKRVATVETGVIRRGGDGPRVDTTDPKSAFFGMDLSVIPGRAPLRYQMERISSALPVSDLLVKMWLSPTQLEQACPVWFPETTDADLGETSRALPDILFCCNPGWAGGATVSVHVQEVAGLLRVRRKLLIPSVRPGASLHGRVRGVAGITQWGRLSAGSELPLHVASGEDVALRGQEAHARPGSAGTGVCREPTATPRPHQHQGHQRGPDRPGH